MTDSSDARWNHNIQYHPLIIDAVGHGARTALDVGTGNGVLAADLHRHVPDVTGIDTDAAVLTSARKEDPGVTWVCGDVMTHPFKLASFDVVASVAMLHHLDDLGAALSRFAELTAPGGVVAAVGLARSSSPRDLIMDAVGAAHSAALKRRRTEWEHTAPICWPPPLTYSEVRDTAKRVLPGMTFRRLTLWRYVLIWRKTDRA